jgi:hypothetical protein
MPVYKFFLVISKSKRNTAILGGVRYLYVPKMRFYEI